MEMLNDLPSGPLDPYRKKASFNWKSMKVHLEGEEGIEYQVIFFIFAKYNIYKAIIRMNIL